MTTFFSSPPAVPVLGVAVRDPVVAAAVEDAITIIQYTPVPTPPWDQQLTHPRLRPSEVLQASWEAYAFPADKPWGLAINLSSMYMGASLAARLGRELVMNVTVTTLDLGMCDLGSDGCIELVKCLKRNYVLERLSLDGNRIGPLGAVALAEYIGQDRTGYHEQQPPVSMFPLNFTVNGNSAAAPHLLQRSPGASPRKGGGYEPVFVQPNTALNSVPYHKAWENDGLGGTIPAGGRPAPSVGSKKHAPAPAVSSGAQRGTANTNTASSQRMPQAQRPGGVQEEEEDPLAPGNPHRQQLLTPAVHRGHLPNLQQARGDGFSLPPPSYLKCPLKSLSISCNAIGDEGCVAIMNAVRHNSTLEFINLRANNITNLGAFAALDAIGDHRLLEQQYNNHCKQVQNHAKSDKSKKKRKSTVKPSGGGGNNSADIFSPMGFESCLPAHLRFDVDSMDSPYAYVNAGDQLPVQAASAKLQATLFRSLSSRELPPFHTPGILALTNLPSDASAKERQAAVRTAMVEHGFASPEDFYSAMQKATITKGRAFFDARWRAMRVEQRNDFIRFVFPKHWAGASPLSGGGGSNPLLGEASRLARLKGTPTSTVSLAAFLRAPRGSYVRGGSATPHHQHHTPLSLTPQLGTSMVVGEERTTSPSVLSGVGNVLPPVDTISRIPLPTPLQSGGGYLYPVNRSTLPPHTPYLPLPSGHLLAGSGDVVLVKHKPEEGSTQHHGTPGGAVVLAAASAFDFVQTRLLEALRSNSVDTADGGPKAGAGGESSSLLESPHPPTTNRLQLATVNHQLSLVQRSKLQAEADIATQHDYHGMNSARLKYGHQVHAHAEEIARLNRVPSVGVLHGGVDGVEDTSAPTASGQTLDDVTDEDLATMKRVWNEAQSPRQPAEHAYYMPSCLKARASHTVNTHNDYVVSQPSSTIVPTPPSVPKPTTATTSPPATSPQQPQLRVTTTGNNRGSLATPSSSQQASRTPAPPSSAGGMSALPVELRFLLCLKGSDDVQSASNSRATTAASSSAASSTFPSREGGPRKGLTSATAALPQNAVGSIGNLRSSGNLRGGLTSARGGNTATGKENAALEMTDVEALESLKELSSVLLDLMRSPLYALIDPLTALLRGREAPSAAAPPPPTDLSSPTSPTLNTRVSSAAASSSMRVSSAQRPLSVSQTEAGVGRGRGGARHGEAPCNSEDVLAPLLGAAGVLSSTDSHITVTDTRLDVGGPAAMAAAAFATPPPKAAALPVIPTVLPIARNSSIKGLWLQLNEDVDAVLLQKIQMVLYTRIPLPPAGITKKTLRAAIDRRQMAGEAIPVEYADMVAASLN